MRSIYVRIALASLVTVVISFAAFVAVSRVIGSGIQRFVDTTYAFELDEGAAAYRRGGREELAAFIGRLDAGLHQTHHLTDATGRELTTGADLSRWLATLPAGATEGVRTDGPNLVYIRASSDGVYRLILIEPSPFTPWTFAPFFFVVLAAIVLLSWWVAVGIVPPLRAVAGVAERFGRGDLQARVRYGAKNEIGTVALAFNGMADRIETLLLAERRLLQDVSHELRSPLTRLNFSAELARTSEDRGVAIDRIQRDIDRLGALVATLIEMTRAEGDPSARRSQPVDLDAVIRDVVEASAAEAEARGCRLEAFGSAPDAVTGDPELLRWSVENVVRNAVRYAPASTAVELTLRQDAAGTTINVRDSGHGVPEPELARIFEPFYRVDHARPSDTGGLGLGLAIARRAILVHHGTIVAERADPGLRITITLPAE